MCDDKKYINLLPKAIDERKQVADRAIKLCLRIIDTFLSLGVEIYEISNFIKTLKSSFLHYDYRGNYRSDQENDECNLVLKHILNKYIYIAEKRDMSCRTIIGFDHDCESSYLKKLEEIERILTADDGQAWVMTDITVRACAKFAWRSGCLRAVLHL